MSELGIMLRIILPQESADTSRERLVDAMKALAEAQQAVAGAIETLDMFERNFRLGYFKQDTPGIPYKGPSEQLPRV